MDWPNDGCGSTRRHHASNGSPSHRALDEIEEKFALAHSLGHLFLHVLPAVAAGT